MSSSRLLPMTALYSDMRCCILAAAAAGSELIMLSRSPISGPCRGAGLEELELAEELVGLGPSVRKMIGIGPTPDILAP